MGTYANNANVKYTWVNDPFYIGWDKMFNRLNDLSKVNTGSFPPYNVIQLENEDTYLIELALAGYSENDVKIIEKDGTLTITGEKKEHENKYLHKGIAGRSFTRSFSLGEHMEVQSAELSDGILNIILVRNIPEEKLPKQIEINSKKKRK